MMSSPSEIFRSYTHPRPSWTKMVSDCRTSGIPDGDRSVALLAGAAARVRKEFTVFGIRASIAFFPDLTPTKHGHGFTNTPQFQCNAASCISVWFAFRDTALNPVGRLNAKGARLRMIRTSPIVADRF